MDDKEAFIARWSRRKREVEAKQAAPAAAEPSDTAPAAASMSATETAAPGAAQGLRPEYRAYFDPQVDEKLRQTALRAMFSDPHFNAMDGLDTYIDDYSIVDPIPAAMLRQLNQAKGLLLFDDEKPAADAKGDASAAVPAGDVAAPGVADTGAVPAPAAADDSAGGTAARPAEGRRKD